MKKFLLYSIIICLLIQSFVFASSGTSTTGKNEVSGTMKTTFEKILQSNKKLKEYIIEKDSENEYVEKALENYRKNANSKTISQKNRFN